MIEKTISEDSFNDRGSHANSEHESFIAALAELVSGFFPKTERNDG